MTPIKLSEAQTAILSTACARDDGAIFPVTANLKGGAVGNVCKSLLKHGLIEEDSKEEPEAEAAAPPPAKAPANKRARPN